MWEHSAPTASEGIDALTQGTERSYHICASSLDNSIHELTSANGLYIVAPCSLCGCAVHHPSSISLYIGPEAPMAMMPEGVR